MSYLAHYGTPRHSGRYPWGSGEDPYQRNKSFVGNVRELKKQGMSEVDIAKGMGMSTSMLRAKLSSANTQIRQEEQREAIKLKDKGYSTAAIAKRMEKNESSVRLLLDPTKQYRANILDSTMSVLRENVDKYGYIDVGIGVENHLNITRTKLKNAVALLKKDEGYGVYYVKVRQVGTGENTSIMVLAKPGISYKEVAENKDKIGLITERSEDGGKTFTKIEPPRSISSDRVAIRYAEDGGVEKDGVIEIRRGVPDLDLGNARYAQVRVAVDDTHYLKGMAMYSDNIPDGADIVFNTNKHTGTPKCGPKDNTVLKPLKKDPDNPFGAAIKLDDELILAQRHYIDSDGKKQLSSLNIVNEEGNWANWRKSISSQMLSKQTPQLAKRQLDLAYSLKRDEFNDIVALTNPTVKKKLLEEFAEGCDAAAVHLKAASLPRQGAHVILPFSELKENEIYAPNYNNGEMVALIRYPHGGTFEIPTLVVNNKNRAAVETIGNAIDAVGINYKVAERLSGADFDGDTVLVIPMKTASIKTQAPLAGLKNFDPKEAYPGYEGMTRMTKRQKGIEMGEISNLITDMTIKGAPPEELCRAVKHSMVVIDAEKHGLNFKQSYDDNQIKQLKIKYQGGANAGAATLISRSKSQAHPNARVELRNTNKMTPEELDRYKRGEKIFRETGETYIPYRKNDDGTYTPGKETIRTFKSTKMAETRDAFTLSSGTAMESIYATYANRMKALANETRQVLRSTGDIEYSPSASKVYANEVASLKSKLRIAKRNAPLERKAQAIANKNISVIIDDNPDMDSDDIKKMKSKQLALARNRIGAGKVRVDFTAREWEAIQSGAVTKTTLSSLLNNADMDAVKQLATPRTRQGISKSKLATARQMLSKGYTQAEVASTLGISTSTLNNALIQT